MTVPYPDPVVISLLGSLPGLEAVAGRVSTRLLSPLPALRVTKIADYEAPSTWEATPVYQVEVWADDEFQAGSLAWALKNHWPHAARQIVDGAVVHGRWIDTDPRPMPDPETDLPRYLVSVGIRLSGAAP